MTYQPNDLNSVKILICYLIYNMETEISPDELYDIAVDSGTINYFYYKEAVDELLINDTIYSKTDENGHILLSLSDKGIAFIKDFSSYVQLSFRNRLMYSAMKYKARQQKIANLSVDYEDCEQGCYLHCIINSEENKKKIAEFRLYFTSKFQAELAAEKISEDPVKFYSSFMNSIIENKT